jgi:hypothetical protein
VHREGCVGESQTQQELHQSPHGSVLISSAGGEQQSVATPQARERMGLPTLRTLQDPILPLLPWGCIYFWVCLPLGVCLLSIPG